METILAVIITLIGLLGGMFVIWRKPETQITDRQEPTETP